MVRITTAMRGQTRWLTQEENKIYQLALDDKESLHFVRPWLAVARSSQVPNLHLLNVRRPMCVQIRADVLFEASHIVTRYAAQCDPGQGQVTDGGAQVNELSEA